MSIHSLQAPRANITHNSSPASARRMSIVCHTSTPHQYVGQRDIAFGFHLSFLLHPLMHVAAVGFVGRRDSVRANFSGQ
eukprot:6174161-Pleurochrysis_carterae.AAC.1